MDRKHARITTRAVAAALLAVGPAAPPVRADTAGGPWPASFEARYRLRYSGVDVGHLTVSTNITDRTYTLSGSGKVSALFGTVVWSGSSSVKGDIVRSTPQPNAYSFDWANRRKRGNTRMTYRNRLPADIAITPPPEQHKDLVAVKPVHQQDAFDPLSAVLMLTRADGRPPCERRVPVFDGKQRYEIEFTAKRMTKVPDPSGRGAEMAHVCRAVYVPVAGHRDNASTKTYASNRDAEVVMRRVPGSEIMIPYSVTIPTAWGTGSMVTERIEVTTNAGTKVAFVK